MGHRSIAFISSLHDTSWSVRRLVGVKEQFEKAGFSAGVHPILSQTYGYNPELLLDISDFNDDLIKRVLLVDRTQDQAEDAFDSYKRLNETGKRHFYHPEDVRSVRRDLAGIKSLAELDIEKEIFRQMVITGFATAGARLDARSSRPLFEKALAVRDATAWICANDRLALIALSFLSERGVAVPKDLLIVGFDNMPVKTFDQRLTSYDFNASGYVHRMLNFIVRPPRPRGQYRHATIEVEGTVMLRDTTGPAKAGKQNRK
jgi:DNA-binding LacI/PurR family transcriptional regulator